jgi:hypothetical protein
VLVFIIIILVGAIPTDQKCRAGCGSNDDYCTSKCCYGTAVVQNLNYCQKVGTYCNPVWYPDHPITCPSPGCAYDHYDYTCNSSCTKVPDHRVTGCCKPGDPPATEEPPAPTPTKTPTPILCPAIVSASPATAVAGDSVNFKITYSHPAGAAALARGYFGFTNACSCDPGEAYCSNFERQLARSLVVFFDAGSWGGVGTIGTGAACSGNSGAGCPWTYFPTSPLPLANASGNATVNSVSFADSGNNRTYTWNVILGAAFPAGIYNYYAMASDLSGHYQDCGAARWTKLSTVEIIAPLAAGLMPRYSSLVLMAPDLGLPAQTLDGTINGGIPPYRATLYVARPNGDQVTYQLTPGASFSFGPAESGDPNFGTTQKGTWRAWVVVMDSASHTTMSPTAIWDVAFYPVHQTP